MLIAVVYTCDWLLRLLLHFFPSKIPSNASTKTGHTHTVHISEGRAMRLELRGGGGLEEALLGLLEVDDAPDRVEVLDECEQVRGHKDDKGDVRRP